MNFARRFPEAWADESVEHVPLDLLFDLIEESYRAVTPKKLAATEFGGDGGVRTASKGEGI
jgi:hypothetical protein